MDSSAADGSVRQYGVPGLAGTGNRGGPACDLLTGSAADLTPVSGRNACKDGARGGGWTAVKGELNPAPRFLMQIPLRSSPQCSFHLMSWSCASVLERCSGTKKSPRAAVTGQTTHLREGTPRHIGVVGYASHRPSDQVALPSQRRALQDGILS